MSGDTERGEDADEEEDEGASGEVGAECDGLRNHRIGVNEQTGRNDGGIPQACADGDACTATAAARGPAVEGGGEAGRARADRRSSRDRAVDDSVAPEALTGTQGGARQEAQRVQTSGAAGSGGGSGEDAAKNGPEISEADDLEGSASERDREEGGCSPDAGVCLDLSARKAESECASVGMCGAVAASIGSDMFRLLLSRLAEWTDHSAAQALFGRQRQWDSGSWQWPAPCAAVRLLKELVREGADGRDEEKGRVRKEPHKERDE